MTCEPFLVWWAGLSFGLWKCLNICGLAAGPIILYSAYCIKHWSRTPWAFRFILSVPIHAHKALWCSCEAQRAMANGIVRFEVCFILSDILMAMTTVWTGWCLVVLGSGELRFFVCIRRMGIKMLNFLFFYFFIFMYFLGSQTYIVIAVVAIW